MKILKFRLWGQSAFFKKPDVNTYLYFTYGNIHKVALLGLLGAVMGYGGYNQFDFKRQNDKKFKGQFPEFYERLKDLKVAIEPNNGRAVISKKVQIFNNSVGYASKELGGNLIVKEQWLENPSWNIYLLLDCEKAEKVADYVMCSKAIFTPYLGKNDHVANICDVEIVQNCEKLKNADKINSLCFKEDLVFSMADTEWDEEYSEEDAFKYCEGLPYELDEETNLYIIRNFVYSNMKVDFIKSENIYKVKDKNIIFI